MKRFLLTILLLTGFLAAQAQQDPLYAQYFNNPVLINPAFTGGFERLYAGLAYRSQWGGIQGAPVTYNFNSHMSMLENRIGIGITAVKDQIGDIRNSSLSASYAYRIKMKKETLSFGLQAGFTRYSSVPNGVSLFNPGDPAFNSFSETRFNTGAGIVLESERYTISFSVPRLLPGNVDNGGGQKIQVYNQNFYLFGSYLIYVSDRVQFKPSALFRATANTPISADINANFVINKLYTIGVITRKFNTYGLLAQMVHGNFRLGYMFEVPGKKSALYYDTHELSLSMSLEVLQSHNHLRNGL